MISTFPRIVRYVASFEKLSIPTSLSWLSESERSELSIWKDSVRRSQWLAGRWIAKRLISRSSKIEQLREVEVLSRGTDGLGKIPTATINGAGSPYRLSISHSGKAILVGVTRCDIRIGVDVAIGVPTTPSFRSRWFTDQEAKWIESGDSNRLPIAWALKESIFKACSNGSKWDPRAVELVTVDMNRVHSRINGTTVEPLKMWVRTTTDGAATAVWSDTEPQGVTLCS